MSWQRWLLRREHYLPVVMGVVDGVLTAMLLAAGRVLGRGAPIDLMLALRVACGALATAGFVYFIARYAELRNGLVRSAAQLNLSEHGRLAATQLGHAVRRDALGEAILSGACSFLGALLALSPAIIMPAIPLLAIACSTLMLGIMGYLLGRAVKGAPALWTICLILGGLVMTGLGFELHLV